MNRTEARKHLTAYADGELEPELRRQVAAHLETDAESRAEVERWRALRRGIHGVLAREAAPAGLEARVRQRLAPRRRRIYTLGVPGLAAAAIALALVFWPRAAAATAVEAAGFARIHRSCALERRHDSLAVRDVQPVAALARLKQEFAFSVCLPDLSGAGYRLDGACGCGPSSDMRTVHAFYRSAAAPDNVVSVFSIRGKIQLCTCGAPCADCNCGQRHYHGGADGDVNVVTWDEGPCSYVFCGRLRQDALVRLADGVRLARLPRPTDDPGAVLAHRP